MLCITATFQRLFRRRDPTVLSVALANHGVAPASVATRVRGEEGVAFHGKAQHGRLAFAASPGCPVHTLTAYAHDAAVVLAQEEIIGDADKAAGELTAAPRLVARLDRHGRVLTGDALFCQRGRPLGSMSTQVRDADGERERNEPIVIVKENQPQLLRAIATLFASRAATGCPLGSMGGVTLGEDRSLIHPGQGRVSWRSCATRSSAFCTERDGARSPHISATTGAIPGKPSPSSAS